MHASLNVEPKPICYGLTWRNKFQIVCQGRDAAIGNLVLLLYASDIKSKILERGINEYIIKPKIGVAICQVGL